MTDDERRARPAATRTFLHPLDYPQKDPDVVGPRGPLLVADAALTAAG